MNKKENMVAVNNSNNIDAVTKVVVVSIVSALIYRLADKAMKIGYNLKLDIVNKIKLDLHK